jgi:hypothetical protein
MTYIDRNRWPWMPDTKPNDPWKPINPWPDRWAPPNPVAPPTQPAVP